MLDQLGPAWGACVAGGYGRYRQGPVNRKIRVVVGDGQVLGRIMRTIYPITNIGSCGQCLEAMQETRRNVEVTKVVVVEQKRLTPTEGWRVPSNVDQNVVHGTVGAADQLRLAAARTSVHATNNSLRRSGLGVLDKRRREARRAEVIIKDLRVEGPGKQAAVVAERLWDEDENVREVCPFNVHLVMLS